MKFLNTKTLDAISESDFSQREPFPWVNPQGALTDEGYRMLAKEPIDPALFEKDYGRIRAYAFDAHNRYRLHYPAHLARYPDVWKEFIREIHSPYYRNFLSRLFGVDDFLIRIEWHYSVEEGAVSPHLDGPNTIGAHLFYFLPEGEWNAQWGGETLVLVPRHPIPKNVSPSFDDFTATPVESRGNRSLLFRNTPHSWHGVRNISAPHGVRRLLMTVFLMRRKSLKARMHQFLKKLARGAKV